MSTLLSVGDRIRPGTHAFQARFRNAVHFHGPGGLAFLVDEQIGAGPVNIVIKNGDFESFETLSVLDHTLVVNGETLDFGDQHIYGSALGTPPKPGVRFQESLVVLEAFLIENAHPTSLAFLLDSVRAESLSGGFALEFARRMREGVRLMDGGDLAGGAASIRGCGYGLTPSGDDFLAGVLIALNVLQEMDGISRSDRINTVFSACGAGGLLSDTFLLLAKEGRLDQSMKGLISALAQEDMARIRCAAKDVLDHGSSSGADLATGLLIALRWDTKTGDTNAG